MEGNSEAIFDAPFKVQSHAESWELGAVLDHMAGRAVAYLYLPSKTTPMILIKLSAWFCILSKWSVKNVFSFNLQFFLLISDRLVGVS